MLQIALTHLRSVTTLLISNINRFCLTEPCSSTDTSGVPENNGSDGVGKEVMAVLRKSGIFTMKTWWWGRVFHFEALLKVDIM